jgi:hypothetical protein
MRDQKTNFLTYRPTNWYSALFDRLQFWWWDHKMRVYWYRNSRPEFRAGKREVERQILNDIEFGYSVAMIQGKILARNYSESQPVESHPQPTLLRNPSQVWDRVMDLATHNNPRLLVLDASSLGWLHEYLRAGKAGLIVRKMDGHSEQSGSDSPTDYRSYLVLANGVQTEIVSDERAKSGARVEAFY